MQLSSILLSKGNFVATISPDASVAELVSALAKHHIGAMVVSVDGEFIIGIVSERDIVRALADGPSILEQPVATIMTSTVHVAPPEAHIDELTEMMTERRIRHVPVTDEAGHILGIVSIGDIVKTRLGELETERTALLDYITRGG
jgi:CBS domain-containing protein